MAKTKRRQLAALAAARAEGKRLSGSDERITSCRDAGPSGTALQSDPSVEIRTQRVIIKIPPLPVKTPPAAAPETPTVVRRRRRKALSTALAPKSVAAPSAAPENPSVVRRRRRKASSTADLTSKSVAASSAAPETPVVVRRRKRKSSSAAAEPISNPAGGAKRRRKGRVEAELKPQDVPGDESKVIQRKASLKLGGGLVKVRRRRAPAHSKLSSKDEPAEAANRSRMKKMVPAEPVSEQVPEDEAKLSKVILKFGKWKREKTIGELGSQVTAEVTRAGRQSRTKVTVSLFSRKRRKVEEEVINKCPPETNHEEEVVTRVPDHTPAPAQNGDAPHLIALEACFSEDLLSSPHIGDGSRNRASSPLLTFKRKRGPAAKALLQASATSTGPEREDISRAEAVANCCSDGILKSQPKQNSAKPLSGDLCTTPSDDSSTVRASKGGATSSGAQAGADVADGSADRGSEQNIQLVQEEPANISCHEDRIVGQETCQSGAAEEDRKPHWQMELAVPFTPGENGVFLVIKQEEGVDIDRSAQCSVGKDVIPRGAELIKQKNQLAIINKRLDAAGGLRNWLVERGLGQFVPIFDEKKVDALTLLQITMTELKEMGMIPVGPRRKLIHALSCLTARSPLTSAGGGTIEELLQVRCKFADALALRLDGRNVADGRMIRSRIIIQAASRTHIDQQKQMHFLTFFICRFITVFQPFVRFASSLVVPVSWCMSVFSSVSLLSVSLVLVYSVLNGCAPYLHIWCVL
ncbi:hypothetical protein R1sor_006167 [Riccia sorocarpa]|uniref:SAM domain-containing protein n=1 Tax=Riccia sorocarpa TaxID=122646 RepID=A0ABD3HQV8_9MARC